MASLSQILSWFKTGLFPTEDQFYQTWNSFFHKSCKIPATAIEGFPASTPNGIDVIKVWIGMEEDLPPPTERIGTKTLYIALGDKKEIG
jgi:hypothetical protein